MALTDQQWEDVLPKYLLDSGKGRIKEGLSQFFDPNKKGNDKVYDDFYSVDPPQNFLQADLLHSVKTVEWDYNKRDYYSGYSPSMLISNSCDVNYDNKRVIDKEALFAPVIQLSDYLKELRQSGKSDQQIESIYSTLKQQEYTNIFYLPNDPIKNNEYIVLFDKIFWHPTSEFQIKLNAINDERFLSLSDWAFYLFITKIAFHLCRVPETKERGNT